MTLTEFLSARIAEDEQAAEMATQGSPAGPWRVVPDDGGEPAVSVYGYPADPVIVRAVEWTDADHIARHDPARVLAECEAKRLVIRLAEEAALIERASLAVAGGGDKVISDMTGDDIIRALALPYAAHPDYREEWKP